MFVVVVPNRDPEILSTKYVCMYTSLSLSIYIYIYRERER